MGISPTKKFGVIAWLGFGCGVVIIPATVAFLTVKLMVKPTPHVEAQTPEPKKVEQAVEPNQMREAATKLISMTGGQFEMAAEDDANQHYTVRLKATGKLITFYWDAKEQKPLVVNGDFSAIPEGAHGRVGPAPQ